MYRTQKACLDCGKPFYGSTENYYCEECAKKRKSNVVRPRICKQCGKTFNGGPRAFYCPECRLERRREASKRARKRGKPMRPLGSIDKCKRCGAEYIVCSGRQKYCSDECQREALLEWQREHKKGYSVTSGQDKKKKERRAQKSKICIYCGKNFQAHTATNMCSDYCREKEKQIQMRIVDSKRGVKSNIEELLKEREDYRQRISKK